MRFDVLTLFPELIESHMDFSIMKLAAQGGIVEVITHNPRDYTLDKHKKVDDTPYGGGAGMVLMPQPYVDCYERVEKTKRTNARTAGGNAWSLRSFRIQMGKRKQYARFEHSCGAGRLLRD